MGKLRPVAATATKVGEIGTGSDKKDILKLEVSNGEDFTTGREENITGTGRDEMPIPGITGREKIPEVNKYEKSGRKNRGDEMDESDVAKIVSEILNKNQMNANVETIKAVSEHTDNKIKEVDQKITALNDRMKTWFDENKEKQDENCTGIGCVKKELAEIKEQYQPIIPKLDHISEEIANQEHEYATCSGPKGCNSKIPVGASFCPNCGLKIKKWPGHPEWTPYWDRSK